MFFQYKSKKQSFDAEHLVETSVWYFLSPNMREEVKKERRGWEGKQKYREREGKGSRGGEERKMNESNDQFAVVSSLISELTELDQVLHQ